MPGDDSPDLRPLLPVAGRVVMLSGANRGIGAAIAARLHADGYRLSLGVRDAAAYSCPFAEAGDPRVTVHAFDARAEGDAARWVEATVSRYGALDALVNNAAVLHNIGFDPQSLDKLDEMWDVNVKAPFRLISHALPHLRRCGHGRIVNMASLAGLRFKGKGGSFSYAMTKAALLRLSDGARHAGWADGVRVTALCPSATDTPMTLSTKPRHTLIRPETIAHLVATILALPNAASVAFMPINPELEATY